MGPSPTPVQCMFSDELSTNVTVADALRFIGVSKAIRMLAPLCQCGDINGDGYHDLWSAGLAKTVAALQVRPGWSLDPMKGRILCQCRCSFSVCKPVTGLCSSERGGDVDGDGSPDVWIGAKSMIRDGGTPDGCSLHGPWVALIAEEAGLIVGGFDERILGIGECGRCRRCERRLGRIWCWELLLRPTLDCCRVAVLIWEVAFDTGDTQSVGALCRKAHAQCEQAVTADELDNKSRNTAAFSTWNRTALKSLSWLSQHLPCVKSRFKFKFYHRLGL